MNKYLERHKLIEPFSVLSLLIWFFCIFSATLLLSLSYIFYSPKSYYFSLMFMPTLVFSSIFLVYVGLYNKLRKKQIDWLKSNGLKISAKFVKMGRVFGDPSLGLNFYRRITVQGEYDNEIIKFISDKINIKNNYVLTPTEVLKEKDESITKIKNHGNVADVWLNPAHPKVYWADTDFLK